MILNGHDAPPAYHRLPAPAIHKPQLAALPPHLLLRILSFLPLSTLSLSVRLVSHTLYLSASHILRLAHLQLWTSRVRYSSEPLADPAASSHRPSTTVLPLLRETSLYDTFIAATSLSSVLSSESELHLIPGDSFAFDIFQRLHPIARTEDLVIRYAREDGLVCYRFLPSDGVSMREKTRLQDDEAIIWAEDLSITLTPRKATLCLPFLSPNARGRMVVKGVLEVGRIEGEGLEELAGRVVDSLAGAAVRRDPQGGYRR